MYKASMNLFLRNIISISVCTCAVMVLVLASNAHAAPNANCTITTNPTPAVITEGNSVSFSGSVTGKSPYTYSWMFTGGSPASSSSQNVVVSYAAAGSYTATMDGTNEQRRHLQCFSSRYGQSCQRWQHAAGCEC